MNWFIVGLLAGSCLVACGGENGGNTAGCGDATQCAVYVASLPAAAQPAEAAPEVGAPSAPVTEGGYTCTTTHYKAAPGFTEMTSLDPTTDVIYPGALIDGASIVTGAYRPISVPRNPITISTSLNGIAGDVAKTIDDPKLSTVRQAINDILLQSVSSAAPANMSFTVEEVYSEEQLGIAVGANMQTGMVNVAGSFNFNDTSKRSRLVAKFIQKYYSIDLDIPASPTEFFKDLNSVTQLDAVSPMYVSTVTYGRLALFTVESSFSATEIKAALDAAYNGAIKASTSIDTTYATMMNSSSIKAFIVGGSGADAAGSVSGYDAFKDYITRGGDYSAVSPGAPISYKLRYLSNNEIGKIVLSSEYDVRNCEPATAQTKNVSITLRDMVSTNSCDWSDNTIDLYGSVKWFDANGTTEVGTFWSRAPSSHSNTTTYPGNSTPITKTFVAPFDNARIGLSADITDWDSISNDFLGGFPQNPTWFDVGTLQSQTKVLQILGGGCHIDCTFLITVE